MESLEPQIPADATAEQRIAWLQLYDHLNNMQSTTQVIVKSFSSLGQAGGTSASPASLPAVIPDGVSYARMTRRVVATGETVTATSNFSIVVVDYFEADGDLMLDGSDLMVLG